MHNRHPNHLKLCAHALIVVGLAPVLPQGVLVEVQLHLGLVLDVKALSHAAYNLTRADSRSLWRLKMQSLVECVDSVWICARAHSAACDAMRVRLVLASCCADLDHA